MTANEFVTRLTDHRPTVESLIEQGWLSVTAERIVRGLTVLPKPGAVPASDTDDPLLDLLARFDTSQLEFGMVTLNPQAMTHIDTNEMEARGGLLPKT